MGTEDYALGHRELGLPRCPDDQPHRSLWRLIPHQGWRCVWAKVRIPRARDSSRKTPVS